MCQVIGKPNQGVKPALSKSAPAFDERFSRVIIHCVGLMPKTKSGNSYFADNNVHCDVISLQLIIS